MYELTRILVILGWIWLVVVAVFIAGYDWAQRARRRDAREAAQLPGATDGQTPATYSAEMDRPSRDRLA